jgi:putative MATE family efflux protein
MSATLDLIRSAIRGDSHDFTTGSLNRAIVLLAIPMMLEMFMESVFALVDIFFVGRLGEYALATVGLTETVITLVYAIAIGLSTAPVAMVSRYIGRKDEAGAAQAARQAIYLALLVSTGIAIFGAYFAEDILRLMGGSEQLIATGAGYTRILFASNGVIMLLFLLNGIFRGSGEAVHAMRALWIANGINIVLDPLFIFGVGPFPELGVTGAAVATTIGRGIGVAYQLYILLSGRSVVRLAVGSWRIDGNLIRRLGRIAWTGAFQYFIASASWIFLMRIVAQFGEVVVSGYTVAIRLILFTLLPAWGLSNAAATLVGQNLGAERPDRAERSVWRAANFGSLYLLSVSVVYIVWAPTLVSWFTTDPAVIAPGVTALRLFGAGYLLFGYGMILTQAFNGAGDTRTPTLINFVCFWLVEIPLGYFLAQKMGWALGGVCTAVVLAESLLTLIAVVLFRRGSWKTTQI